MRKFKYLVVDHKGVATAFLFPETESHADVAKRIDWPVLGAGFVSLDTSAEHVHYEVSGCSASLHISCRAEDQEIINRQFGGCLSLLPEPLRDC